jgi:hypothetical protein
VYSSYLDVDEIVRCEITAVPQPQIIKAPPSVCTGSSGTGDGTVRAAVAQHLAIEDRLGYNAAA